MIFEAGEARLGSAVKQTLVKVFRQENGWVRSETDAARQKFDTCLRAALDFTYSRRSE